MKLDLGNMLINSPQLMRYWQIITLSSAIGIKDKLSVLVNAWSEPKISQILDRLSLVKLFPLASLLTQQ